MSESILAAIITSVAGIFGAIIGALADIEIAEKTAKKSRGTYKKNTSQSIMIMLGAGAIGLILGLVLVQSIFFGRPNFSSPIIDLGSSWVVSDQRYTKTGAEIVYKHYPAGNIKYSLVQPDDSLAKVFMVCGFSRTNIFNYFRPIGEPSNMSSYQSAKFFVRNGCYIEFTVRDILGNEIGIYIQSEPVD